jgi:hypothetical protein
LTLDPRVSRTPFLALRLNGGQGQRGSTRPPARQACIPSQEELACRLARRNDTPCIGTHHVRSLSLSLTSLSRLCVISVTCCPFNIPLSFPHPCCLLHELLGWKSPPALVPLASGRLTSAAAIAVGHGACARHCSKCQCLCISGNRANVRMASTHTALIAAARGTQRGRRETARGHARAAASKDRQEDLPRPRGAKGIGSRGDAEHPDNVPSANRLPPSSLHGDG